MCAGRVEQEDGVKAEVRLREGLPYKGVPSTRSARSGLGCGLTFTPTDVKAAFVGNPDAASKTPRLRPRPATAGRLPSELTQGENQLFQQPRCIMEGATVH